LGAGSSQSAHPRRKAAALAQHPENAAVDDWIDAAYDWGELR
jgi:hypothetical protein